MLLNAIGEELVGQFDVKQVAFKVEIIRNLFFVESFYHTNGSEFCAPDNSIVITHDANTSTYCIAPMRKPEFESFLDRLKSGKTVVRISISQKDLGETHWFLAGLTSQEHFDNIGESLGHNLAKRLKIEDNYLVSVQEQQDNQLEQALRRHLDIVDYPDIALINAVINPMHSATRSYRRVRFFDKETQSEYEVMLSTKHRFGYRYGLVNYAWESLEHNLFGCDHCDKGVVTDTEGLKWPCYSCIPSDLRAPFFELNIGSQ